MSKPIPTINRYKADLREMNFLLFEQFRIQEILSKGAFEAWGEDEVKGVLQECYRFAREVAGPLNARADAEGCHLENGKVRVPAGFKEAWNRLFESGLRSVATNPEFGGGGAPYALAVLVEEILSGANTAFNMYAGLAFGASEVIETFGTQAQKDLFCTRMYTGKWGGTMCLTEPHAGSDVGSAATTAKRNPDGTYSIRGTKIFITGGDHDLAENIVHLVLARAEGAPAGTKGLTLFIVPKRRVDESGTLGASNNVHVAAIEHKMGLNGSATCVLNFGEGGDSIGYPVGGDERLNQGMPQMFRMMNVARIAVGVQGVAVASSAYLNALEYARERKQGASMAQWKDPTAPRVSIIEHADVRRMLLDMKSRVEGIRALAVKLAYHVDNAKVFAGNDDKKAAYHQGQVDLLVPLVKAYGTDQSFRVCETAMQTFGGAGYTRDYPVEQYCRDAKIFSIYEGTNHIQAMDLVGRKLGQAGGANFQAFMADVGEFVAKHSADATFGPEVKKLSAAMEALGGAVMNLLGWFQSGRMEMVPLNANRLLEMMSECTVGWMLLDGGIVADAKLKTGSVSDSEKSFYQGKIEAARFYVRGVLPSVELKAKQMQEEDRSPMDISDASFATL